MNDTVGHQGLNATRPALAIGEEVLTLGEDFNFDGFQVVRQEFFAHLREPSITFNNGKFGVNTACISKFPSMEYAQVLINRETKILALRPCADSARDAFRWCTESKGKRKPRTLTCRLFFAKIIDLMGWDPQHRYKLLGKLVHANGIYLIAFDLTSTEVYERTTTEGAKPKTSRIPAYPAAWKNQFGLSFEEHEKSMQINTFDGYAIYSVRDNTQPFLQDQSDGGEVLE